MKRIVLCMMLLCGSVDGVFAQREAVVAGVDCNSVPGNHLITQKIAVSGSVIPSISLVNIKSQVIAVLPEGVKVNSTFEPDIFFATERKQRYASLIIPVYRKYNGIIEQLMSYDVLVTYASEPVQGNTAQKPTGASHSVLASGAWYKIAVPRRGIYKIDYNFLQANGINPASVNPANIRIYGNGGTMLSEKADSGQPDDLIQNAVLVHGSGSSFGQNDYVLFYANGPVLWEKDSVHQKFIHTNNYYEDQSYYFLNFDKGPGLRIAAENATGAGAQTYTQFNDYRVMDADSFNLGGMGKIWWGNRMNSSTGLNSGTSFNMSLGSLTGPVEADVSVGNVCEGNGNEITMKINGVQVQDLNIDGQGGNFFYGYKTINFLFSPASPDLNVQFSYNPHGNSGSGYIDYVQLNYERPLTFTSGQMAFRNWESAGLAAGQDAGYKIGNASSGLKVWDITNPLKPIALNGQLVNNSYQFTRPGNSLKEFIAFDGSQFEMPSFVGTVANQDLHGLPETDLIIITNNDLKPAAEDLAAFHRSKDHIHVVVATVDQIYNEFSSGGQDIAGIRNFIKMFYDRSTGGQDMVKNVLMLGAASYDYKNRIPGNTNIVPAFQTPESADNVATYSSDDFFGFLDDGENINNFGALLDVGIGRIPAYNLDEAQKAVDKIRHYAGPASFGPWKNVVSFVADDVEAGMNHLNDCENVNRFFSDSDRIYNLYKIYSDAYPIVAGSGGNRYPAVNKAINDQIFNGTFLMSYSGHGSPERWSHEAILTPDDYEHWTNKDKLPLIITATCDFGRFDDPAKRSAGAKLMLNPDGGSIAMITTTQAVYAAPNTGLVKKFVNKQFTPLSDGSRRTLGEALTAAKNDYGGSSDNNNKFVILGDPALKLQIPVHRVRTDSLLMEQDGGLAPADTIVALGRYLLKGSVVDDHNNELNDFNGSVYVSIFDKPTIAQTIKAGATPDFKLQTNIVAKVKSAVTNGKFTAQFIAPKDINYDYGLGKISYYANSDQTDAAGLDTNFTVGGVNENAVADNTGPVVTPYIDDDKFRDGGVTGPNPMLYVKLYDDNGINVSGSSLGHDLVAVLDEDIQDPMVMNEYYQTLEGDYKNGFVYFPLYNLPDGEHTIRVKAWDVYNNSGEGTVHFVVKNKEKGFISDLYNYPNPVYNVTHFVFQHNQEGEKIAVSLQVFNTSGAMVWSYRGNMETTGNRSEITWDGKSNKDYPLARGVYFYRLKITTEKGITATAYQKLVLLR